MSEKTGLKKELIEELVELAKKHCVKRLVLFGSRARGDYKEKSDIDLAFDGGDSPSFIVDVNEATNTLLFFDIVDLKRPVQKELLDSINREGIVLYEKI